MPDASALMPAEARTLECLRAGEYGLALYCWSFHAAVVAGALPTWTYCWVRGPVNR